MKRILKIIWPLLGGGKLLKYIFLGISSGLFSFLFINFLTRVVNLIIAGNYGNISQEYIIVFSSIILLFIWTRRTLSLAIITLSQTLFWDLRKQILSLVLKSNYQQLSSRRDLIQSAIVNDVNVLTQASISIIDFVTSSILAIACLIYLASISWVLFSITLVIAFLGTAVYHFGSKRNIKDFDTARKLENKFLEHFNSILNGFKEIYMEPQKGRAIYDQKN